MTGAFLFARKSAGWKIVYTWLKTGKNGGSSYRACGNRTRGYCDMSRIWTLSGLSWNELAKRVWQQIQEDDVFGRAAQLSYYFLLALFPLLLFLMTLLGYFAESGSQIRNSLIRYLGTVMPGSAIELVHKTIDEVSGGASGGKLSFGLLAALWAASNGMTAVTNTLNVAYDGKETRPWWKVRLVAIGLTIALAFMIILGLTTILLG